ncbi:hypothetical protein P167DRAFT_577533 [Morchella conica CCBAS932]|uniref:Uncharacterized protein n=1 Tax=Morchella conica CCBAS932 TaxID=1392247 RepID=A0A3N4KFG5_9PEZI|nr:hypothetical protein P167DRAFT_577533 [Morchella conica CCBAS932]
MSIHASTLSRKWPAESSSPYQSPISENADRFSLSNTILAALAVLVAILTLFKTWKVWKYCRRARRSRAGHGNLQHGLSLVPSGRYQQRGMIYHGSLTVQYLAVLGERSEIRSEHE